MVSLVTSCRQRRGPEWLAAWLGKTLIEVGNYLIAGRLTAALEMAVLEGKLVRNVAKLVTPPEYTPRERVTWSKAEVRKFLAESPHDRLHAAWRPSLYGLRRAGKRSACAGRTST